MHRPDAATVSLTHVQVSADSVLLRYAPGSPCECRPFQTVRMRRSTSAACGEAARA